MIETHKRQARYCYNKYKAYQPLTSYWHEADLVVHSEFRDGNAPVVSIARPPGNVRFGYNHRSMIRA